MDVTADDTSASRYDTAETDTAAPYLPPAMLAKRLSWDVFLSFRGEDTRKTITPLLKKALESNGVRVFIDDEGMRKGDVIKPSLEEAIVDSALAVAIISPNYADSHWCLDELCRIFEVRKRVIPVFYGVDPSDIRGQKGNFGKAHKEMLKLRNPSDSQKQAWVNALKDVGNISGYTCTPQSDDTEVILRIVKQVVGELKNTPVYVAKFTVGLDSRVDQLLEKLDFRLGGVRFLNIHGTPGIGKTTLAKAAFNKMAAYFKKRCFISNVRERLASDGGTLIVLNLLISDLSLGPVVPANQESAGRQSIKEIISQSRVLVVLDDVSVGNQLKSIGIVREWFEEGSRIVVTSRNKGVLLDSPSNSDELHEVVKLSTADSLELFSIHAMGRKEPTREFLELSREIVSLTDGLPLALEVFGSSLVKKTMKEWEDSLLKLREIRPKNLQDVLKISYDALDPHEKTAFLDISCLLLQMNMTREGVVDILEGCDIRAESAIGNLVAKSLMKISEKNHLWMHDQIRDMGKQIVAGEHVDDDPGKRSRLWDSGDIRRVLRHGKATEAIRGIILNLKKPSIEATPEMVHRFMFRRHPGISTALDYLSDKFKALTQYKAEENGDSVLYAKSFRKMTNLKLLQINYSELRGNIKYMPSDLRCLQWRGCPRKVLSANLLEELRVLDVSGSNIHHLWSDWSYCGLNKVAGNLVVLNLSQNHSLTALPDMSGHRQLQKLILERCVGLTKIHESIGSMSSLVHLNLRQCSNLVKFPSDITGMKGLKELILSDCYKFKGLPHDVRSMKSLILLLLDGTAIQELPKYLFHLTQLEVLNLNRCKLIKELPEWIGRLSSLKDLSLSNTNLKNLPSSVGSLSSLEIFNLVHCSSLAALPDSIRNLKSLIELHLHGILIDQLPPSICSLSYLKILSLGECRSLTFLPVSIQGLASITELDLDNTSITELPDQICSLKCIRKLQMNNCTSLVRLPKLMGGMSGLTTLWIVGAAIKILPESIGELENLSWLNLNKCKELARLPDSIGGLRSLHVLTMEDTAVTCLPESFGKLECLKVLKMRSKSPDAGCGSTHNLHGFSVLPASFCNLSQLQEFDARSCRITGQIHDDFAKLSKLEILDLGYNSFHSLPSTLEGLCFLEKLLLRHCVKLRSLPRLPSSLLELLCADCYALESICDLSNLHRLQELQLANCNKLTDVPGLECLKSLRRLFMGGCNASASAVRGRLSGVTLRKLNSLSVPGSEIPDWFSEETINFATRPNRAIKNVIVAVVISVNLQKIDDIQAKVPSIVGIKAQILRQSNPIFSTTLNLIGIPRTKEDQLYLCRYKDYHPLVSLLREGDSIQAIQQIALPGVANGVELKRAGIYLVFENDDDYEGDEGSLPLPQQSVTQRLVQFFQSY